METKHCKKCGRTLPVTEFYTSRRSADGLQCHCKDCQKEYFRQWCTLKTRGGNLKKVHSNPSLAAFTPRQLMDELKARGYSGTLRYIQQVTV